MRLRPLGILIPLSLSPLVHADVLDVDSATGPYTEIRDAVAAATTGDVIRVASGTYGAFGMLGKGLRIVPATPSSVVQVQGAIRIQNLAAGDEAVLIGIDATAEFGSGDSGLTIANCAGAVRVEDGDFIGIGSAGTRILGSVDVTMTECSSRSGDRPCVTCDGSSVTLFGGEYRAPSFAFSPGFVGASGVDAIVVHGGDLFAQGSSIEGGWGGDEDGGGLSGCSISPGDGGNGILAIDAVVRVLGGQVRGGPGGIAFWCPPAANGARIRSQGTTTVTETPGVAVTLEAGRPWAREGRMVQFSAAGEPQRLMLLVVGPEASRVDLPAYTGDLLTGGGLGATRRVLMGPSPAQLTLVFPQLPPLAVEQFWLQAVQLRAGDVVFGPVRSVTVLDDVW